MEMQQSSGVQNGEHGKSALREDTEDRNSRSNPSGALFTISALYLAVSTILMGTLSGDSHETRQPSSPWHD